jgi:hypothetical protein
MPTCRPEPHTYTLLVTTHSTHSDRYKHQRERVERGVERGAAATTHLPELRRNTVWYAPAATDATFREKYSTAVGVAWASLLP